MLIPKGQSNLMSINNADIVIILADSNGMGDSNINIGDVDASLLLRNPQCLIAFKPDFTTTVNVTLEVYNPAPDANVNRAPGYARVTSYPGRYGWDAAFVKTYTAATKRQLVLLKFGIAGSSLCARNPPEPAREWQKSSGGLYNVAIDSYIKPALKLLTDNAYKNNKVKCVVVEVLTNDAFSGNHNLAAAAIPLFVNDTRFSLNLPTTPYRWIQVRADLQTRPSPPGAGVVNILRNALTTAVSSMSNIAVYNGFENLEIQSDGTHLTPAGYTAGGIALANEILPL